MYRRLYSCFATLLLALSPLCAQEPPLPEMTVVAQGEGLISGNGEVIVFSRDGHLFQVNFDGTGESQLTQGEPLFPDDLSVSDDGRWVAFESSADPTGENPDGNREIFVIDATTGAIRQLTVTNPIGEGYSLRPSISGDGSLVAFKSENTYVPLGFPLVFVMSTTGGDPVLISPMPDCAETLACNQSFAPAISGNGKKSG